MISEMGLLCGGSCGAAMSEAVKAAKELKKGQRIVVILPDSVRNYMTKFLSDDWMIANNFMADPDLHPDNELWWHQLPVSVLALDDPIIVSPTINCQKAMEIMNKRNVDQLPVVDPDGSISGA